MTDATVAAAPPPAAPARSAVPVRTYLLAGCSVGGTLCASLASTSGVNLPFAILSAVFGGIIVLITAAPALAAPAAPAAATVAGAPATVPAMRPAGTGSVSIGISAAVLSFIMNQVAQFFVGGAVFSIVQVPPEQMMVVTSIVGLAVLGVRVPFDLLLGAYLLTRARNIFVALAVFLLTYIVCYAIEQLLSTMVGMSGLVNTIAQLGFSSEVWTGLAVVLGVPLLAQAVGGFGAKIAGWLMRPKG